MAVLDDLVSSRKLVAILSADIAGYSALMRADEEATVRKLQQVREAVLPIIEQLGGRVIDLAGDGILAEFPSAVRALESAAAVQTRIACLNAESEPAMVFRIGVNVGDIIQEGDRLYGDGINVAARLQAIAEPGGVCISNKVHEEVRDRTKFSFRDMGDQELKNISRPVRAFALEVKSIVGEASPTRKKSAPSLPDRPSIAILPFTNMSGDPEQEFFADGIVEDITTALSRIRWLFVIARNSSFTYKGRAVEIKQVARELGVRYILEGSVRKSGQSVRVTTQLLDAANGVHLWADRFDRALTDVFAVQDEITSTVASIIEPALGQAELRRALARSTTDMSVWELYQRGISSLYQYNAEDNAIAQTLFRRAREMDPNFAAGYYGSVLSQHLDVWLYGKRAWGDVSSALRDAKRAVSLDDQDFMAHAMLSLILQLSGQWDASIAEGRISVKLNPNSPWSVGALGHALGWAGSHEEGTQYLREAMRMSPHDPLTWLWTFWTGIFQYLSGSYTAALDSMQDVMRISPGHAFDTFYACRWTAISLGQLGRAEEAREWLDKAVAISPEMAERIIRQRPPWMRPRDHAQLVQGMRKAGWVAQVE